MVKIYFNRIVTGQITIKDVPEKYKQEVKQMLIDNGYPELAEE